MATTGCRLNHLIFTASMTLGTLGSADVVLGRGMSTDRGPLPSDLAAAHALILAERDARQRAEALVSAAATWLDIAMHASLEGVARPSSPTS